MIILDTHALFGCEPANRDWERAQDGLLMMRIATANSPYPP